MENHQHSQSQQERVEKTPSKQHQVENNNKVMKKQPPSLAPASRLPSPLLPSTSSSQRRLSSSHSISQSTTHISRSCTTTTTTNAAATSERKTSISSNNKVINSKIPKLTYNGRECGCKNNPFKNSTVTSNTVKKSTSRCSTSNNKSKVDIKSSPCSQEMSQAVYNNICDCGCGYLECGEIARRLTREIISLSDRLFNLLLTQRLCLRHHVCECQNNKKSTTTTKTNNNNNSNCVCCKLLALEAANRHINLGTRDIDSANRRINIGSRDLDTANRHFASSGTALELERDNLGQRLRGKSSICDDLENQLVQVLEKNTELAIQNTDLHKQVQQLQHVSDGSSSANRLLGEGRGGEATSINTGGLPTPHDADRLDSILRQMREAADRRKELEREHSETLSQLRDKQAEVQRMMRMPDSGLGSSHSTSHSASSAASQQAEKIKTYETVEALQSKIRELEKKTELQNVRHEELLIEMASIKRSNQQNQSGGVRGSGQPSSAPMTPTKSSGPNLGAGGSPNNWRMQRQMQDVPTSPESGTSTPESMLSSATASLLRHGGTSLLHGVGADPRAGTSTCTLEQQLAAAMLAALPTVSAAAYHGHHQYPGHASMNRVTYQHQSPPNSNNRSINFEYNIDNNNKQQQQQIYSSSWPSSSEYHSQQHQQPPQQLHHPHPHPQPQQHLISNQIPINPIHPYYINNIGYSTTVPPSSGHVSSSVTNQQPQHQQQQQQQQQHQHQQHQQHQQQQQQQQHHQQQHNQQQQTSSSSNQQTAPRHDTEIDRIMAKIEQDNRILAELDKSRSTIDVEGYHLHHHSQQTHQQNQQQQHGMQCHHDLYSPDAPYLTNRQSRHALLPKTPSTSSSHHRSKKHHHRSSSTSHLKVPHVTFSSRGERSRYSSSSSGVTSMSGLTSTPGLASSPGMPTTSLATLNHPVETVYMSTQPNMTMQTQNTVMPGQFVMLNQPNTMTGLLPSQQQTNLTQLSSGMGTTSMMLPSGMTAMVQPQSTLPTHFSNAGITRMMPKIPTMATLPSIFTTQFGLDNNTSFLNGTLPGQLSGVIPEHLLTDNKLLDMLDIPGKGRCYVYMAKYSYDPFKQSPNEHPEGELAINAGDYLLVWGNMDEDGFFDGELLDGRRGLVPSNFVHKLVGDELLEFHQAVVLGLAGTDDCNTTSIPHGLELHDHDPSMIVYYPPSSGVPAIILQAPSPSPPPPEADVPPSPAPEGGPHFQQVYDGMYMNMKRMGEYNYLELEDILEEEDETGPMGEGPVPPPKQLTLERQLNKSILIGWNTPDCPPGTIDCYHVYVNGVLKTTVKATERTRALVEGVDSNRPHRISVRSVTPNRRTSRDAACTMVVGKDVPLAPTTVRATNVTSSSAVISWLPSNSNCQHVVCVNNVEVRTLKPGVYRHTITGLAPNTTYRVTVRAKNIRAPYFDEKNNQQVERLSCHIDFRTLPKGLPDPPVDIQVESGPQDGTMLVTWLPVNSMNSTSGGAPVTGYAVYADGKKVTDVDSPTGDHALIDINKIVGLNPRQVTVRTKSRDAQSSDSSPTPIPPHVLKGKQIKDVDRRGQQMAGGPGAQGGQGYRYGPAAAVPPHMRHGGRGGRGTRVDAHGQVIIDTEENLSDKEIYPPSHMNIPSIDTDDPLMMMDHFEITKDSTSENFSEDDFEARRRAHYPGAPRSHVERGRPPPPPNMGGRPHDMHDREPSMYYGEPPHRGRDPRNYRGGPPQDYRGRGGPPGAHHGQGPPGREKRVRWFVALFDYDPTTMSPNPDACEEELPFSEGDNIKIYGEKDADGFYWGECRGRRGFVPYNMVMEVQDPGSKGEMQGPSSHRGATGGRADRWGDIYANMPVKKMVALYDYDPQELSPNVDAEVELSFKTGNIIYVYGEMDDDGFYMGELDGMRGLVPSNFLTESMDHDPYDRGPRARGHGPGARGPPPPPRGPGDPRDRRKDPSLNPHLGRARQEGQYQQGPGGMRGRGGGQVGPQRGRGGRGGQLPSPGSRDPGEWGQNGTTNINTPVTTQSTTITSNTTTSKPMKGLPSIVPDFVIPNKESPTAQTAAPKFPEAPNFMQKFTEIAGAGVAEGDNLISKGKELIFKKFGLGN